VNYFYKGHVNNKQGEYIIRLIYMHRRCKIIYLHMYPMKTCQLYLWRYF